MEIQEEHGNDAFVRGMDRVPKETQAARAECLEEFLTAGIEVVKINKMRGYLERRMGVSLTESRKLMNQYLPPLKLKELKTLKSEFKGELIGVYHDGTTHGGECFTIVFRACLPGFIFRICCARVRFLRGSMNANQISAELIDCIASYSQVTAARPRAATASEPVRPPHARRRRLRRPPALARPPALTHPSPPRLLTSQMPVADVLAMMSDCVSANIASYRDSLAGPFPHSEHNGCIPHTGSHVGENMDTPHVDEFMVFYNMCVGMSNYAQVLFAEVTGHAGKKKSGTRWFSANDV